MLSKSNKTEDRSKSTMEMRSSNTASLTALSNESGDDVKTDDDDYEAWHVSKKQELQKLCAATDEVLNTIPLSTNEIDSILHVMASWNYFNASITPEMNSLSEFRRKNPQYPPSEFMTSVSFEAAAKCQTLLAHLLAANKAPPSSQVEAYKLSMQTWSNVYHPSCGDRVEDILEAYGERFGGDMDRAPTLDCYKMVLDGHVRSCSSYFLQNSEDMTQEGRRTPGEKAWEILNLLSSVSAWGDLYLKPDLTLYSQAISVMRNTLMDWRGRMRDDMLEDEKYNELAMKSLTVFEEMESLLEQINQSELSLHEWHCIVRAYTDAIAIVSRANLHGSGRFKELVEVLLPKLEEFVTLNSAVIAHSAGKETYKISQQLSEVMRRNIEQAYTNAISSQLILTKTNGYFDDFNAALNNERNSEKIFLRMKTRSEAAPIETQYLFPSPTQEHYDAFIECICECLRNKYSTPESNKEMARLEEFPHNKALRVLEELEKLHSESSDTAPIDGSIYTKVVWAKCQVVFWKTIGQQEQYFDVANSIQDMVQKTMERHNQGLVKFFSYGEATKMYNSVFRFYSKRSKNKGGGMGRRLVSRTLRMLDELEHWHDTSDGRIKPDEFTFNLVLKILADNETINDTIFERMKKFRISPNEKHYLTAMRSNSRDSTLVSSRDTSLKAESILQQAKEKYKKDKSVKPTTTLFTACISEYGDSSKHNHVAKILELANELKDLYETTKDAAFKPDEMFYSATLDALSKAKGDSALHHALQFLDEIENKHAKGILDNGPNRYAYTNVLHAITKSSISNGAKIAEDLIQRMIDRSDQLSDKSILPDTVTYTALFQIFANSRRADSTDLAEKWFNKMELQYKNGDNLAKPNKRTYTALINCWATRSNRPEAPEKAERILSQMEKDFAEGSLESKPDAFVYGAIIKAWSMSKSEDKAIRVWDLYRRMISKYESGDMEMMPNIFIVSLGNYCTAAFYFSLISQYSSLWLSAIDHIHHIYMRSLNGNSSCKDERLESIDRLYF
jgi:hypothetical protein